MVVNARTEFERASAWLGRFAARAGLSEEVASRLQIALDEVLSNVILHGLAGAPEGQREIGLAVRIEAGQVALEVTDDGPAFDPTRAAPALPAGGVGERREGGLGLLFVRTLMDEVRFTRRGERNCTTLCKRLAANS